MIKRRKIIKMKFLFFKKIYNSEIFKIYFCFKIIYIYKIGCYISHVTTYTILK